MLLHLLLHEHCAYFLLKRITQGVFVLLAQHLIQGVGCMIQVTFQQRLRQASSKEHEIGPVPFVLKFVQLFIGDGGIHERCSGIAAAGAVCGFLDAQSIVVCFIIRFFLYRRNTFKGNSFYLDFLQLDFRSWFYRGSP